MRLWTLHPKYLDDRGLVNLWREALLAQSVLRGKTSGYRGHPQLHRFRSCEDPLSAIAYYLRAVHEESVRRERRFDRRKIGRVRGDPRMEETEGQLRFEWAHLLGELGEREPGLCERYTWVDVPDPHPLFTIVPGRVREWEKERR
jgi:hypothetical protein